MKPDPFPFLPDEDTGDAFTGVPHTHVYLLAASDTAFMRCCQLCDKADIVRKEGNYWPLKWEAVEESRHA